MDLQPAAQPPVLWDETGTPRSTLTAARNQGDAMVHTARKTLTDAADKVTDEEKAGIEAAITALEEALKGSDAAEITAKTEALTEAVSAVAQKMYADAAAQGEAGGAEADAARDAGDDVVDAEFEEVKDDKK